MNKDSLKDFSVCELGAIMHYIKKVTEVIEGDSNQLTPFINAEDERLREFARTRRAVLDGMLEQFSFDYDSIFREIERKCKR